MARNSDWADMRAHMMTLWMRGDQQVDTETAIADLTQAHFLATCTIPDWLKPRPNATPGWHFSLKDGVFLNYGDYRNSKSYPDDPMRADEERWARTHQGCGNSWSGD